MTKATPDVAVCRVDLQDSAQILDCSGKGILGAQDAGDALHRRHGPLVELQSLFVALHGAIIVLHLLREGAHLSPDGLGQLAEILRRRLGLVGVRRMAIDLGMRWMRRANMMRRDARCGRRLLVLGHEGRLAGGLAAMRWARCC